MFVKDVMTENPITIGENTSLLEAREIMTKNNIKKLPVTDKNMRLIGIVTNSDLLKASPSSATTLDMFELGYLLSKLSVKDIMVKSVKTAAKDQTVEEAARFMADYKINCLPVVKGDLLVGIVTESDLFSAFIEMFNTRTSGVRVVLSMPNAPGEIAKLAKAIAEKNGNIVSFVTSNAKIASDMNITLKVTDVDQDALKNAILSTGATVEDMRMV